MFNDKVLVIFDLLKGRLSAGSVTIGEIASVVVQEKGETTATQTIVEREQPSHDVPLNHKGLYDSMKGASLVVQRLAHFPDSFLAGT